MVQKTLGLADGSLFVKQIKHKFKKVDVELLAKTSAFLVEIDSYKKLNAQKAASLLLHQNADAIAISCSLLAPLIWYDLIDINEIQENLGGLNQPLRDGDSVEIAKNSEFMDKTNSAARNVDTKERIFIPEDDIFLKSNRIQRRNRLLWT